MGRFPQNSSGVSPPHPCGFGGRGGSNPPMTNHPHARGKQRGPELFQPREGEVGFNEPLPRPSVCPQR